MEDVERCLFDLRRGLPIRLQDTDADVLIWPVEHLDGVALERLRRVADAEPALVVTGHRLASILGDKSDYSETTAARVAVEHGDEANDLIRWACAPDASLDAQRIQLDTTVDIDQHVDGLALYLMRRALLLPAAMVAPVAASARTELDADVESRRVLCVDSAAVHNYHREQLAGLKRVSEANIPLAEASRTRFVVFREPDAMREHIAILIGDSREWPKAVPVRVHSACLTGDLFGSLRCDCGEQLRGSVSTLAERGGGVLLYLAQEGRSIGLANKLRAYHLQDEGLDTVDADQVLGFGEDERRYQVAAQMLAAFDIQTIDLLTNNPAKLAAMGEYGIDVASREAIYGRLTHENHRYLSAKATRSGHWLDSLLDGAVDG